MAAKSSDNGRKVVNRAQLGTRTFLSLAGLTVFLLLGCAREEGPVVASMRGWKLTLPDLQKEYERLNGAGTFEPATAEQRIDLAETLVNKEALLRMAREACPQPDQRRARHQATLYEDRLERELARHLRANFHMSKEDEERQLAQMAREAKVKITMLPNREASQAAVQDLQSGLSFEQVAELRASRPRSLRDDPHAKPTGPLWKESILRFQESPYGVIGAVFLKDLKPGEVTAPIETQSGIFLIELIEYQPSDLMSNPELLARAKHLLEERAFADAHHQFGDSLRAATGFVTRTEADSVIQLRFQAYWDSLTAAGNQGAKIDNEMLRAPLWHFTAEERKLPVFDLRGKTITVADFVPSLDRIGLQFWPRVGTREEIHSQIEVRGLRWLFQTEAEKLGLDKQPELAADLRREEESGLLDQFRETALLAGREPTEEEIRAEYEGNPDLYRTPDEAVLGILTFPPDREARAHEVLAQLQSGAPELWLTLGPAEQKADPRVTFVGNQRPVKLNVPATDPAFQPILDAAVPLTTGQLAGPIKTAQGWTVLRVNGRRHSEPMNFETAKRFARTNAANAKADAELDRRLAEMKKKLGAKVHSERLALAQG